MICAVCTSPRGPFALEPLGRDDALVSVCRACRTETPDTSSGERAAYTGGAGPSAPMVREMNEAMDRMMGAEENARTTARAIRYGIAPGVALTGAERDLAAMRADGFRRIRTGAAASQALGERRRGQAARASRVRVK